MSHEAITIVIPAYNEENVIGEVLEQIHKTLNDASLEHEVIVVDDGSTDNTGKEAEEHGAKVCQHPENLGYGRSLKDGISAASNDIIVITDADGTYPIDRIPDLVEHLEQYHMVIGARRGKTYRGSIKKRIGRWCFRALSQFATGRKIPDINSGLRVFRKSEITPFFPQISSGFSFTTTCTLAYMLNDYYVLYKSIKYEKRHGASKVRYGRDTLRALQIIIEAILFYNPIKIFILLAMPFYFGAVPLLGWAIYDKNWTAGGLSMMSIVAGSLMMAIGFLSTILVRKSYSPMKSVLKSTPQSNKLGT